MAHLAGGHGVRAGVEENTSALRALEVSELGAVRPLEARRLENKRTEGLKRIFPIGKGNLKPRQIDIMVS